MKIVAIETHLIRVPCDIGAAPTAFLGVGWSSLDTLLVRVVTDEGLDGWGEGFGHACCPATRIVVDTQLAPAVLGEDARDIRGLMARLAQRLHLFGRNGPHVYALSALDVALWDIAGKAANLPLWRLLGGAPLGALPAYASLLRYSAPAEVAKACARALDQGYRAVKLHEIDVPQTRAARDAVGPNVSLMLDVNCPWSVDRRNRHGPSSTGLRSRVAGGASLAAGAPCGSCPCPPRGRPADRGRRERGEPVRGPGNAGRRARSTSSSRAWPRSAASPKSSKLPPSRRQWAFGSCRTARISDLVFWPRCIWRPHWRRQRHSSGCSSIWKRAPITILSKLSGGLVTVPDAPGLGRDPDLDILRRYALSAPTILRA